MRGTTSTATSSSASRRGGRGGHASSRRDAVIDNDPKTQLVTEWRAHEEDCAVRVIQRQARAFVSRMLLARLVATIYEKQYDPIAKRYYYVNTRTNESTWEKPKVLSKFLAPDKDVATKKKGGELSQSDAAKCMQCCARAFLARRAIRSLVREAYMKLFNAGTKCFYYLNTITGDVSYQKPALFRRDNEDIDIEPFYFRKAVVKITTTSNLYGSGVLGRFCGVLCVLTDGATLPSVEVAQSARVVCNYAEKRIPFNLVLASETFFARIQVQVPPSATANDGGVVMLTSSLPESNIAFALCAVDEAQFKILAGNNIVPLTFMLNDRKLGCIGGGGSVRRDALIEVIGHPHGKMQVLHVRHVAQFVPNSINPIQFQYDKTTETGAAGSAVFTRGGKLLGMQAMTKPLKEAPGSCWHIKPILDSAMVLVTPPDPLLLASCITSHEIHVYWQIVRWYKPLRGLPLHFELEICCHRNKHDIKRHDLFVNAYTGSKRSRQVGGLQEDTLYSIRCRAVNAMKKGNWSTVMRFITLPNPSMAWRLAHCATIAEAIKLMAQSPRDPRVHLKSLQWIFAQLNATNTSREQSERVETELLACHGIELVVDMLVSCSSTSENDANVLLSLHVLAQLVQLRAHTQRFLSSLSRMQSISALLERYTPTCGRTRAQEEHDEEDVVEKDAQELRVPLACLALLGSILDQNDSAKQLASVCGIVPLVLSFMDRDAYRHQPLVVAECCYLLGVFSYANASGKWDIVDANGLALLRDTLDAYIHDSKVLYWALVTLGNVVYACSDEKLKEFVAWLVGGEQRAQLDAHINALHLVEFVCTCRTHFLTRVHDLELELIAAKARLAHLQAAHIGEGMRNDMEACAHEVATLEAVIAEANAHNVAHTADYALRYLLTPEQIRVQQASTQIMRKFLHRKLTIAYQKWCEVTVFTRHRAIFLKFFATVKDRQLSAAFRRWEGAVREMWRHKSVLQTIGSGLAINLTKKKKERYRMLVLQK
uniref:WW domain-containing protein n=1 Tax=Globisporangium ultimum (strain ATCC 200006 / CBS 805.95 / DAOM BR144) TaxID=431595 RepID=K3WW52_GLOUD